MNEAIFRQTPEAFAELNVITACHFDNL